VTVSAGGTAYGASSFWFDSLPKPVVPRPSLPGDATADVAIVGAGFTGLWTAYHLARLDPALRIVVLEKEVAGHGASGRNGGWCSALFAASWSKVARARGAEGARALQRALVETVDAVGRFCADEGVAADYARGGTLVLARSEAQLARLRAECSEAAEWGVEMRWLSASEATSRVAATRVLGAVWTPDCAAVHPARLVRGLAEVTEKRGVAIYEGTAALRIAPGSVETAAGRVRAPTVVRATEGFTPELEGRRRTLAPIYSLMIATDPLPESVWAEVGWRERETLADGRHLIIYAQRTADGRIAFGGRGAPYHYGSRVRPAYDRDPSVFAALRASLVDLLPAVRDAPISHRWGGPLGVARDWFPSVTFDRASGLGSAGGYVGDGVACSALAGRTLAELICGHDTGRTRLPWVNHRSRRWEPEPLRWLGITAVLRVMAAADRAEARTGRPSRMAETFDRLIGR
jgi:glycine/D-amino acid oxidase-like deaminating enzyme